ncbi:MAG TPA: hypothetical protein VF480_07830, partial [Verrucomicrobiae bacterium]
MTIRTRLTSWYAGIMFVSLLTMGVMVYKEFAPEPRNHGSPPGEQQKEGESADESDLRETLRIVFWCGTPALLLALSGGWWLMKKSLAPVAGLTQATQKITAHNLGERLPR